MSCGRECPRNLLVSRAVTETERKPPCDLPRARGGGCCASMAQDASSITASMPIRAGSLTLKMTASVIRADGPGLRASGKVSFHRLQCGCAVEARRMMRAEASLGTGARTERACSLSAWRARGRRQRGRPRAAGAVVRARSGCTTMCWRSPLANKLARRFPYAGASNHRQCCFSQGKCSGQLRTLGHAVLS